MHIEKSKTITKQISDKKAEELIKIVRHNYPGADIDLIKLAFDYAKRAHSGQFRESGEPYFIHPLEVAFSLAGLGMDETVVAAALLHDVLEDTDTSEEFLKNNFGEETTMLVSGVTKLDKIAFTSRKTYDAKNIQKMLLASSKDIRVIIIKLADKLHNMRTLSYLKKKKQLRIAKDALEVYVPLAQKLGINVIRRELENEAFKHLYPEKWKAITGIISKIQKEKTVKIDRAIEMLKRFETPKAEFVKSHKGIYEIVSKMKSASKKFAEIHDYVIIKVLCEDVKDCYIELGNIHSTFKPVPTKFKDLIAVPKDGMIQGIKTTAIGPDAKPIKFYIQTKTMDEIAEKGLIACMQINTEETSTLYNDRLIWLNKMINRPAQISNSKDIVKNLNIKDIHSLTQVFGASGEVIELPKKSTVLDFAFMLYPNKVFRSKEAIVNGRLVPLWYELESGNIVEMEFGKRKRVDYTWSNYVTNPVYADQIKYYLKKTKKVPKAKAKTEKFRIKMTSIDRVGILADVTSILAKEYVNIQHENTTTSKKKHLANIKCDIELTDPNKISKIVDRLSKLKGVTKVNLSYLKK